MRQERFFGRTRTIRFRVHPHPDFHRARPAFFVTPALSRVEGDLLGNTAIPGLTPIVIRGRMRLYAPDDCSIVITSVRREKQNAFSPRRREEREANQEEGIRNLGLNSWRAWRLGGENCIWFFSIG
jgi:hypothetical protein